MESFFVDSEQWAYVCQNRICCTKSHLSDESEYYVKFSDAAFLSVDKYLSLYYYKKVLNVTGLEQLDMEMEKT